MDESDSFQAFQTGEEKADNIQPVDNTIATAYAIAAKIAADHRLVDGRSGKITTSAKEEATLVHELAQIILNGLE